MDPIAHIEEFFLLRDTFAENLKDHGLVSVELADASSALTAILAQHFSAIVIDPDSPVYGDKHPDLAIWLLTAGDVQRWQIGEYLIKAARRSPLNAATPIYVHSPYHPRTDRLFPDAEQRLQQAGANGYYYKNRPSDFGALVMKVVETFG